MKKLMLLMLGAGLVVMSCKKTETENTTGMNDSAMTDTMIPADTMTTTAAPMDTTAAVRDSAMNGASRTNGTNTNTNNRSGNTTTRTDSVR